MISHATSNFLFYLLFFFLKINQATSSNLYRSYYPHRSSELVSPVCGIFVVHINQILANVHQKCGNFFCWNIIPAKPTLPPQRSLGLILEGNWKVINGSCSRCKDHMLFIAIEIEEIDTDCLGLVMMEGDIWEATDSIYISKSKTLLNPMTLQMTPKEKPH